VASPRLPVAGFVERLEGDAVKRARERGQVMVLAVVFLCMALTLLLFVCQAGFTVGEKIRLQTAADFAVLSALGAQAGALNALAVNNRAILAQDAFAARLNALVSEAAFYRKVLEKVSWLVRLIPVGGPLLGSAVSRGGEWLELAARTAARAGVPAAGSADTLLAAQGRLVRASLIPLPPKAAIDSAAINAPRARISPISLGALLLQDRKLFRGITPLPGEEGKRLLKETLDPHTARRNWSTGIPGMPIRKRGGTEVERADFAASDRLQFKVWHDGRWRWRSIVSTRSRASEFSYRRHGELLTVEEEAIPRGLTLLLTQPAEFPLPCIAPAELPLSAVSSGRIAYRRAGRPDEPPGIFNPFWTTGLIPVAEEEGAKRLLPAALLREIRH
jgi:hypothetical protein